MVAQEAGRLQAHSQKFQFVENLSRIPENLGTISENPDKNGCLSSKNGA